MASIIKADTLQSTTANVFVLNSSGTEYARFDSTGVFQLANPTSLPAGTAAAPSITATGDTNTGLYFPAADTIAFSEGGVEAMRIDSSGRVGIGVTPSLAGVRLTTVGGGIQLSGGTTSQEGIRIQRASGYASISGINNDNNAFNPIAFFTSGTEAARIDTSNNLLFNSGYGSAAIAYGCRAWVNFNGTSTVAIRASGNVTSITDNGTGSYAVNFTTAMPDTNYAAVMATKGSSGAGTPVVALEHASLAARTTTSIAFYVLALSGATPDADVVEVAIFR